MRSILIGGGVAGCAVAAALRNTALGQDATIIERRAPGAPAGMGFILMPNGLAALDEIAPEFDWRGSGQMIDRVLLRTASGKVLDDTAIEPAACVGRERFLSMLRAATGSTRFLDCAQFVGLDRDSEGATQAVRLSDGSRIEGDAFFGCDGTQSQTRSIVFPEAKLGEVVVKEIVSTVHAPGLAARLGNAFHKFHDEEGGFAVGMLAESSDRVVWFVQFDSRRWPSVGQSARDLASFVQTRVERWNPMVGEVAETTDFSRSHLWPTRDLAPLASLSLRNLALVGDAAHACLPFTSQGANGALVDAALLGKLLGAASDGWEVERAFEMYGELRRPHHRRMYMEGHRLREAFLAPIKKALPVVPLVA